MSDDIDTTSPTAQLLLSLQERTREWLDGKLTGIEADKLKNDIYDAMRSVRTHAQNLMALRVPGCAFEPVETAIQQAREDYGLFSALWDFTVDEERSRNVERLAELPPHDPTCATSSDWRPLKMSGCRLTCCTCGDAHIIDFRIAPGFQLEARFFSPKHLGNEGKPNGTAAKGTNGATPPSGRGAVEEQRTGP
jgi:hypothetical protein